MHEPRWRLEMSMVGPCGERYTVADELGYETAREVAHISSPDFFADFVPGGNPMETVVTKLKRREFRKDLFQSEAVRLATLLAERMEDAEGWHGVKREEPARRSLTKQEGR